MASFVEHKVDAGGASISFASMRFLKVWLAKHIMVSDQRYGESFIAAGSRPRLNRMSWTARLAGHLYHKAAF
jgi:hemerythrin